MLDIPSSMANAGGARLQRQGGDQRGRNHTNLDLDTTKNQQRINQPAPKAANWVQTAKNLETPQPSDSRKNWRIIFAERASYDRTNHLRVSPTEVEARQLNPLFLLLVVEASRLKPQPPSSEVEDQIQCHESGGPIVMQDKDLKTQLIGLISTLAE